jgi:hypothetical protein
VRLSGEGPEQRVLAEFVGATTVVVAATTWPLHLALTAVAFAVRPSAIHPDESMLAYVAIFSLALGGYVLVRRRRGASLFSACVLAGVALGVLSGGILLTAHEYVHDRPWLFVILGGSIWSAPPGGLAGAVFGGSTYPILLRVRDGAGLRRVLATASTVLTIHGAAFLGMSLLLRASTVYAATVSALSAAAWLGTFLLQRLEVSTGRNGAP